MAIEVRRVWMAVALVAIGGDGPAADDCCGRLLAMATCTGSASCRACTNCSRCAHCKSGGTCGVCARPITSPPVSPPAVQAPVVPVPVVPIPAPDTVYVIASDPNDLDPVTELRVPSGGATYHSRLDCPGAGRGTPTRLGTAIRYHFKPCPKCTIPPGGQACSPE